MGAHAIIVHKSLWTPSDVQGAYVQISLQVSFTEIVSQYLVVNINVITSDRVARATQSRALSSTAQRDRSPDSGGSSSSLPLGLS
jgi:hypothetical protein